jgi:hypothetical protein
MARLESRAQGCPGVEYLRVVENDGQALGTGRRGLGLRGGALGGCGFAKLS